MPEWTSVLRPRLARLKLGPEREAEIVEELSQHLDERLQELVAAGVGRDAAVRQLVAEVNEPGDLLTLGLRPLRQARVTEAPVAGAPRRALVTDLWQDVRYASRMLGRQRGFAAAAVLTLALGIGVNTAIFSVVNAMLLRRMPVRESASLVNIGFPGNVGVYSYPGYAELRDGAEGFDGLAAFGGLTASLNVNGETTLVSGAIVTGNYFEILGVGAERGRVIQPTDDITPMAHPVAAISHGLWRRTFGGEDAAIGRKVVLNGQPFTIVGVVDRQFAGTQPGTVRDIYVPMMMQPLMRPPRAGFSGEMNADLLKVRTNSWLFAFGRLKGGVTAGQADTSLSGLANALAKARQPNPPPNARPIRIAVTPIDVGDPRQRAQMVSVAQLLLAVVGAVLLIACANVANLMLSRAASRRREIALRLALGASRWRLVRQLLTESVLIAVVGGACGVGLASGLVAAFRSAPPPAGALPIPVDFALDGRVLTFALALSVVTGIVFGLLPAISASRPQLAPTLKVGGDDLSLSGATLRRFGLKRSLVVAQVALSLVLLIAAGLFGRSLGAAMAVDPGFDSEKLASMPLNINLLRYTRAQGRQFYQDVTAAVRQIPGVEAASVARVPVAARGGRLLSIQVEGRDLNGERVMSEGSGAAASRENNTVAANVVGAEFFKTLGVDFVRGRDFDARDTETNPRVAVVNEQFERSIFPKEDAIGRRVSFTGAEGPWVEIVGVVRDSVYASLDEAPTDVAYLPISQNHETGVTMYVRAAQPEMIAPAVRRAVQAIEPNLPVSDVTTVTQTIGGTLYVARMGAILLGGFGVLALVLAAVGIYGVLAFSIAGRTRELGIRMALGASTRSVFLLVVRDGMALVAIGTVLGLAGAVYGSRSLRGVLYGVSPTDTATFAGVVLILAAAALAACVMPARRATRVDPMVALK